MCYTVDMIRARKSNAPGLSFRVGLTYDDLIEMLPDEATAERWFEQVFWGQTGRHCGHCGATDTFRTASDLPSKKYRCRTCGKYFTVKTDPFLQGTHIPLSKWIKAIYLMMTSLRGIPSMKIHRDLKITQKSAWFMMHRIRNGMDIFPKDKEKFSGEVEVDETYIGGKERNKHASKKLRAGRGAVGKVAVMGVRERETGLVKAEVVNDTSRKTLHGFIRRNVSIRSQIYTDEAHAYKKLIDYHHESVNHSKGEFVRGRAHTNSIESFWASFKRGLMGSYFNMSHQHLHRYFIEFYGRNNIRTLDTLVQISVIIKNMVGTHLPYKELTKVKPNGK